MRGKWRAQRADGGAHAARGFVGGAAVIRTFLARPPCCFNAARGFVGGATRTKRFRSRVSFLVSMPHAALWVVQQNYGESPIMNIVGFNAARGFVGGAAFICSKYVCSSRVSMPHAALWVVQLQSFH